MSERTDGEHHDEGAGPGIGSEQPADQRAGDLQRAVGDPGPAVLDEALLAVLTEVRDRLGTRIRCLARNRDALDAWLWQARQGRRPLAIDMPVSGFP